MKCFHVHLHVRRGSKAITPSGCSTIRLSISRISTRGAKPGIDHLGLQTDDPEELAELKARAEAADLALFDEGATSCCYARSDKHWITDPQGIAWEHFHTLGDIPVFSEHSAPASETASACCAPEARRGKPLGIAVKSASSCC